jgi:hypothetical protein
MHTFTERNVKHIKNDNRIWIIHTLNASGAVCEDKNNMGQKKQPKKVMCIKLFVFQRDIHKIAMGIVE